MGARIVNLSRGGVCARGPLPAVAEGQPLRIELGLPGGVAPIAAGARIAWVAPRAKDGDDPTFGLCFVELDAADRARLDAEVAMPQPHERNESTRAVRLRLDGGPVLRATAESVGEHCAVVSAELPWLRVHSTVEAELEGRAATGRVAWVGMELTPSGGTRLRMRLELTDRGAPKRRDQTLNYFSSDVERAPQVEDTTVTRKTKAPSRTYPSAKFAALVRTGFRRRAYMAVLRVAVAALALSATVMIARAVRAAWTHAHEPAAHDTVH